MKRIVLSTLLFANILSLSANDYNAYEATFLIEKNLNSFPKELDELLKKDDNYKLGILQLTNQDYMGETTVKHGDPHTPEQVKEVQVKVPNFHKAYENFKLSYAKYQNPLSSFILTSLIKTSYGTKNKLEDFAKYSKINYENKLCSGYIDYGESLQRGYFQKVNLAKAKEVYEEGVNNCKTSWYGAIISSKLMSL
jgi:hypothetical protein